ncbi:MAG: hypothetical protein ACON4Z_07100 [Planctomycetota bacterium]
MNKQDDARRKRLRRLVKGEDEALQVASEDLRWLLDETGRLQQANDRLRKQNKRLRQRQDRGAAPADGASRDAAPGDGGDA